MLNLSLSSTTLSLVFQKLLKILLYLLAGWLANKTIVVSIKKLKLASEKLGPRARPQHQARLKTLRSLIKNTARFVVNFTVFLLILTELGVNIAPLITGASIVGLAVGFGAKSLIADLIAGFFIILENQFNVGDRVKIGTSEGRVIRLSLRTTTLKDDQGRYHIIPNSAIKAVVKFPKKS